MKNLLNLPKILPSIKSLHKNNTPALFILDETGNEISRKNQNSEIFQVLTLLKSLNNLEESKFFIMGVISSQNEAVSILRF